MDGRMNGGTELPVRGEEGEAGSSRVEWTEDMCGEGKGWIDRHK